MEPMVSPEYETNVRSNIEYEFIDISRNFVPLLRAFITTNTPGNPQVVLEEFRKRMDALYTLSSDKKELNKEIIKEVDEWLNTKTVSFSLEDIGKAIKLFERFKTELIRQNMIRLG